MKKKKEEANADKSFEDYMKRLQEIVSKMQSEEMHLNESLALYKEGIECSRHCREYLENAKKEIEIWQNEVAFPKPENN